MLLLTAHCLVTFKLAKAAAAAGTMVLDVLNAHAHYADCERGVLRTLACGKNQGRQHRQQLRKAAASPNTAMPAEWLTTLSTFRWQCEQNKCAGSAGTFTLTGGGGGEMVIVS